MSVKRSESGWPAHFIWGDRCVFHRATILDRGDVQLIVSTVGAMRPTQQPNWSPSRDGYEEIGCQRHYETMAFHLSRQSCGCPGSDVLNEISFASKWSMKHDDDSHDADAMHEAVVIEIMSRLATGESFAKATAESEA